MRLRDGLAVAAVAGLLGILSPAATMGAGTTQTSAPPAAVVMIRGTVVSSGASGFTVVTGPLGPYCPPGAMCPAFLTAARRYLVVAGVGTAYFGDYIGQLPSDALRPGAQVVVYGTESAPPQGSGVVSPGPQYAGTIAAEGVYLLREVPRPCAHRRAAGACPRAVRGPKAGRIGG